MTKIYILFFCIMAFLLFWFYSLWPSPLSLSFHLMPFPWCFPAPLPPSSSFSLQSISSLWPGRLTAAPPEEYQSMLLWRRTHAPLCYMLTYSFTAASLFAFGVNGPLGPFKVWLFRCYSGWSITEAHFAPLAANFFEVWLIESQIQTPKRLRLSLQMRRADRRGMEVSITAYTWQ